MQVPLGKGIEIFEDIYNVIEHFATGDQVRDLLRKHKYVLDKSLQSEVLISADTKKILCQENLRNAVEQEYVPISEVYELLREIEENGGQHIYVYNPTSESAKKSLSKGKALAVALIGENWQELVPRTTVVPNEICWCDFRELENGGWVLKAYVHQVVEKYIDDYPDDDNPAVTWKKYETFDCRAVCLAFWSEETKLLQLRVGKQLDSEIVLPLMIDVMKKAGMNLALLCEKWDLRKVRSFMLANEKEHSNIYECGAFRAIDKESYRIEGAPHAQDPEQPPYASSHTKEMVSKYAKSPSTTTQWVVVHFKPVENIFAKDLRVAIGTKKHTNELIINAATTSKAIHYVIAKLSDFRTKAG